ncbi:MAG: DUF393 domain-containing protein [Verrucomicrobiae bacterium]|nr:DUF393 domain-containing protein [Verrucomicrobiae bacterium]MCP5542161.1 DUF393 domain-containing protein [Akkermansiaceae bacterium]
MSDSPPETFTPGAEPGGARDTRHVVLYDSDCPLCTFQMKSLTWLDWLDRVRFAPIAGGSAAEIAPHLTREDLMEAIHCVTPAGEIHRGARAIRFLGWRMPALWPVALFLSLPGVIWVAEAVYRFVSRHRLFLSRLFGCRGACALMPERRREGDDQDSSGGPAETSAVSSSSSPSSRS